MERSLCDEDIHLGEDIRLGLSGDNSLRDWRFRSGASSAARTGGQETGDVCWNVAMRRRGEGESIGPASKIAGKQTGRMVAGGVAIENTGEETGPFGGIQWGETDVYDPASKTYRYLGYQNDGAVWQGTASAAGNVWKYSGTMTVKGTSYRVRTEATFTPDGKSFTWKAEVSTDGKTWAPWAETKATKTP